MPLDADFLVISALLSQLLSVSKYDKAHALLETMEMTPDLRTYFIARINDHRRYLGPSASGKKPTTQ